MSVVINRLLTYVFNTVPYVLCMPQNACFCKIVRFAKEWRILNYYFENVTYISWLWEFMASTITKLQSLKLSVEMESCLWSWWCKCSWKVCYEWTGNKQASKIFLDIHIYHAYNQQRMFMLSNFNQIVNDLDRHF